MTAAESCGCSARRLMVLRLTGPQPGDTPGFPDITPPARAINRLALTALLAACATAKTIVDESAARAAISEEAAAATD
jgi:hypothetical protein